MRHSILLALICIPPLLLVPAYAETGVMVKDLTRLQGVRDNSLYGYGLVTGLAGTGDSIRNQTSIQSLSNALTKFNIVIPANEIRSRNVAAVMVTATLPPYAQAGDSIDVNVTSLGDARSLVGGTLLLADLRGPDQRIHALAQGSLSVGGYSYDVNGNLVQKNHPTSAIITGGAVVELGSETRIVEQDRIRLVLNNPDIATAYTISDRVNEHIGQPASVPLSPAVIEVDVALLGRDWLRKVMEIQDLIVVPSSIARVVINEKTGTIVSGGGVFIAPVSVSHGDIKVTVRNTPIALTTQDLVSSDPKLEVRDQTELEVTESRGVAMSFDEGASISELLSALDQANASSREIISILQAIKSAGALHGELVVQ